MSKIQHLANIFKKWEPYMVWQNTFVIRKMVHLMDYNYNYSLYDDGFWTIHFTRYII